MSSILEERNIILQKTIPKLITSITGFTPGDENFKLCLQFSWSHFKHHRFLSVNSHEVKRDVEGICEKLKLNNFHDEEKKFRKMVEESVSHELSVDHYEKDVMYGIISLLTTLAYDPINKLKDKKRRGIPIFIKPKIHHEEVKRSSDNFINSLLRDNFELVKNDTDSDLSDWTESEDEELQKSLEDFKEEANQTNKSSSSNLKPPQKIKVFEKHKILNAEKWLKENIQNSWWSKEVTSMEIVSSHPTANFCQAWQKHLSRKSMGFIKPQPVSLLTEYCLLREILWMFINPVDCKFFKLENHEISLRPNVTLPSTSTESLHTFLSDFVTSINILYNLNRDIEKSTRNSSLSHTHEKYFNLMQKFINEIHNFVLEEEEIIKMRNETYTTVTLYNKFQPHLKMLSMLYDVHKSSIIEGPTHIQSAYLIANLNYQMQNCVCKEKKNLCITFLLTCLKTFLDIFNIWWTEARLQDLKNEFIVEKISSSLNNLEIIEPRLFEKSKEKSFYVNDSISKRIVNDSLVSLMTHFAREASFTLEIISNLDRIHEMKQIGNDDEIKSSIYEDFMVEIGIEIEKFSSEAKNDEIEESQNVLSESQIKNQKLIKDLKKGMQADGDDLMLVIFNSTFENLTKVKDSVKFENPLELYKNLNSSTNSLLIPLELSIERIIKKLLKQKISIAERFVMNIFLNEFLIIQKLLEIRKVFFIDCAELINFFTIKIFPLMEVGDSTWANPYTLTVALNEAIGSSPSLIVNVNRKSIHTSVLDAIDEISLCVNMTHHQNLDNFFTSHAIQKYNEVFRFLLKIKWGQRILNCLLFPDFFKHRTPYTKMNMLDLVIKRLALTRFSMLQAINTIHNHLMVLLQGLSHHLDLNLMKAEKITDLISQHKNFVEIFHKNAFLDEESKKTRGIIIEMLKLAKIVKDEWNNVETFAMLDEAGKIDDSISLVKLNTNTIEIERAFKACENQLKDLLDS